MVNFTLPLPVTD